MRPKKVWPALLHTQSLDRGIGKSGKKLKNLKPTSLRLAQKRRQKTISRAQVNFHTMSILILSVFFRLDSVRNAKKVHAQLNEFGEATIQLDGQDYVLEVQKGRYLNLIYLCQTLF